MWVDKILHPEIDPLVEEGIKVVTEEITTIGIITDQIIEIDLEADGTTIGQVIGVVITQITIDKVIPRPNYRQNPQWTFRNRSQSRNRNERGRSRDRNNRRREESRSQSNSRVSTNRDCVRCYRCREYDHFMAECPNTPTNEETDYEDADPASLQIMSQNYSPNYSERKADYLNL